MKILGIWPAERKINKISSYVVLTSIGTISLFIAIPQMIHLFIIWGDFDMMVENLSLANITVIIAILKTTLFWANGKTLKTLLSGMEEDRKGATIRDEVNKMMKVAKLCRTISTISCVIITFLVPMTSIVRLWMNRYTGRMMTLISYYPYDMLSTPNYEITMACQIIAGYYCCYNYTMVDLFLATLVLHVCGQLSNLKKKFRSLCSNGKYAFQAELASIVKKHNSLYRFAETIEHLFNKMLLAQVLGCTILLCIQSFQAIVTITGQKLEIVLPQMAFFGIYIAYILVQLYLYCYISEKLHSESMEMIEAAYEAEWYNLSPNEARSLMLIMIRARSPLRLTAGKFCSLNHELFSTILKTSMSYLSVLYAMKTENE